MAKLTAKARKAIPTGEFAEPKGRKYPIENASHARNALARVSQHGTSSEKAQVRAAVHRKYPNMSKKEPKAPSESLEKRGHFEHQGKAQVPSHAEFHALDHGHGSGENADHMIGRNKRP